MKYVLLWIAILGVAIGVAVWAEAQQSRRMQRQGGMMGGGMMGQGMMRREIMGGNADAAQGAGDAASTFANLCVSCHGATGKGDGPAAGALFPKPKDFGDCKRMALISDESLFKAIDGGGQSVGLSPIMPPWGGSLTGQQVHDLVRYIRSLCKK